MNLTLNKISKAFGEKTLFRDFTYSFPNKGIFAIKGDSGVGKTTLLRIIAGLEKDFEGEILPTGYTVSIAFQEYRLFQNLSALRNVTEAAFGNSDEDSTRRAKSLLSDLNFTENDMNLFPSQLSGGMKQRVSLARAILHKSDVLILDEVTKELDEELVKEVHELIKLEAKNRLVIIVSHDDYDLEQLSATVINL